MLIKVKKLNKVLFIILSLFSLASCGSGGGDSSSNTDNSTAGSGGSSGGSGSNAGTNVSVAAKTSVILPGDITCAFGGVLVETGIDENSNGILDVGEVDASEKVCNGSNGTNGTNGSNGSNGTNGLNALVKVSNEAAGANCSNGGKRLETGLDTNANGSLESSEVTKTDYICDRTTGSNGTNGSNGSNGTNGTNGSNGLNALIKITNEAAGANCSAGGQRIDTGLDSNNNSTLDNAEITNTQYTCDGTAGTNGTNGANGNNGLNALVNINNEAAGANCPNGGKRIDAGLDANTNGFLDNTEIASTDYICDGAAGTNGSNGTNGTNGNNGLNSLINMTAEPVGINCPNGGLRIDTGIDSNSNGTLEPAEINQTGFVCSGTNGALGWQVARLIEFDNSGDVYNPQIAMDASGNAVAVWSQSVGTSFTILTSRFDIGKGWGGVEFVGGGGSVITSVNPKVKIVMNDSGNVMAIWSALTRIYGIPYVPGLGWWAGAGIQSNIIDGANFETAKKLQVAMDDNGNIMLVWYQITDGWRNHIWSNRYDVGTGWGVAKLIETISFGNADSPQIAMNANGNAIAVWSQMDNTGTLSNIWSNRFVVGTGWGVPELIETSLLTANLPQIAMDASGNAVAVWSQWDGTMGHIWSNRFVVGTGWGVAELIETTNVGDAQNPQIAIDASGNALAVWSQMDSTGAQGNIWSNQFVVGTGWGVAELIETNLGAVESPQISMNASGNAMAVWSQSDGIQYNIWSNRFVKATGWGTAQLVETNPEAIQLNTEENPQIAINASGNAMAVWHQFDGIRNNIWSNRWLAP